MDFYPVWPPFAGFAILVLLAGLRPFASADMPPAPRAVRQQTIDGLRGFLALGVLFHHGAIYHLYLRDGIWVMPPSGLYALLGSGGVSMFFMITGYLFWGRLIDERGRPDWARLYVGRLFRIGPVYLLAILGMVGLVMMQAGWRLRVPPAAFVQGLAPWLALGFLGPADIDGHPATLVLIAGVTWSLHYEWLFYLALPLLAVAAGPGMVQGAVTLAAVAGGFAWAIYGRPDGVLAGERIFVLLFLVGMGCAALGRRGWGAGPGDRVGSAIIVLVLLIVFRTCETAYTPLAAGLLGICFYLMTSGCSLFGLLNLRGARRLGDISYGIYMLQGLVLATLFQYRPVRAFALLSPWRHWAVVLAAAAILVVLATLAHHWIERPGILLGRRVARLLPRRSGRLQVPSRAL